MPSCLDNFTEAVNGTAVTAHTSDSGHTWSTANGSGASTAKIQANRSHADGSFKRHVPNFTPASADYDVEVVVRCVTDSDAGGRNGAIGRQASGAVTYISAGWNLQTNAVELGERINGGTDATLGSYALAPVAGQSKTIRLVLRGNQASVYVDGTLRIGPLTVTTTAAGKPGCSWAFASSTTGAHIDSFLAQDAYVSSETPSGTVVLSGGAVEGRSAADTRVGAVPISGVVADASTTSRAVSGAVALAGVADEVRDYVEPDVTGSLDFSGAAGDVLDFAEVLDGGLSADGSLVDDFSGSRSLDGTILLLGGGAEERVYPDSAGGTVTTDGSVVEAIGLGFSDVASGGVLVFGAASEDSIGSRDIVGAIALGGRRRESIATYGGRADRLATYAGAGVATYDEE